MKLGNVFLFAWCCIVVNVHTHYFPRILPLRGHEIEVGLQFPGSVAVASTAMVMTPTVLSVVAVVVLDGRGRGSMGGPRQRVCAAVGRVRRPSGSLQRPGVSLRITGRATAAIDHVPPIRTGA